MGMPCGAVRHHHHHHHHHCVPHSRDRSFDCYNAGEYHQQMLRYYEKDINVVEVVPRKVGNNDYLLVCLRHKQPDQNSLCEVSEP